MSDLWTLFIYLFNCLLILFSLEHNSYAVMEKATNNEVRVEIIVQMLLLFFFIFYIHLMHKDIRVKYKAHTTVTPRGNMSRLVNLSWSNVAVLFWCHNGFDLWPLTLTQMKRWHSAHVWKHRLSLAPSCLLWHVTAVWVKHHTLYTTSWYHLADNYQEARRQLADLLSWKARCFTSPYTFPLLCNDNNYYYCWICYGCFDDE